MKWRITLGLAIIFLSAAAIAVVLSGENAVVVQPKGLIAKEELRLILTNIFLMLSIILPTYLLLLFVVWKYCIKEDSSAANPDYTVGPFGEALMWGLPSLVVAVMAFITWEATHQLDPYKSIESDAKALDIQVVALDWKWLFIYPEQGIAVLNRLVIPEKTPIHFHLTADNSPMSSFWIPQLSGQIYSMTGMSTQLHVMADHVGEYKGRAVEINGEGYADMTFLAKAVEPEEFETWVKKTKDSPRQLDRAAYEELIKPAVDKSIIHYSRVEDDLYKKIINKYMYPTEAVL